MSKAHSSEGTSARTEQHGAVQNILSTLNEYKEIIGLIVFFLGGISWVYGYFATKEQVKFVKCLMNTNVQLIQYQLQEKLAVDERHEYEAELIRIKQLKDPSIDDEKKFSTINDQIEIDKKRVEMAMTKIDEANQILQSNQCEEPQATPAIKAKE